MNLEERASTWGTVPFGTSRVQVRHLIFFAGVAAWLIPTLIMTGIQGIVWFSFNLAFVLILTIIATPFRTVSLQRLATCFFAGGLAMGMTALVCLPLASFISSSFLASSPLRPFLIVPIEETFKLLPVALLLWRGRKFSLYTLGATDLLLMGAFCGAGFAFVEDAYAHAATHAGLNNLSVWLPSSELINGRIVSGHGIWTGLAAATIGLGWMFRHMGKWWLVVAASGFIFAGLDHLALNFNLTPGAPGWGTAFFNFISGNGVLPLVLFLAALVAVAAADTLVQLKSLPAAREFKLPTRKDRKESLQALWDCILDLRRLAYAHFRYKNSSEGARSASLSLTVALLTKRLINRYLEVEPQQTLSAEQAASQAADQAAIAHAAIDRPTVVMTGQMPSSSLAIRGPGEAISMPRAAGQAAPPDFGKLTPGDKRTADLPITGPVHRKLIEVIDLPEQYEVIEEVSEGGMGVIFRGRHRRTGARLAIKVMHPHLSTNQTHLRRFEQEARTASTLHHPNIVIVHDFGITPNSIAYLVMEWLDGSNLDPVIRVGGTLSLDRFLTIFMQATSALAHAHRKGVVHRDIKPSNIILATTAEKPDFVKIVDFGIAKVLSDETEPDMNLTRTGDILGSPLFMSPEQCLGNKMDARSDIYSLGCVMYEALVGVTPLSGANAVQLIYKHVHEMPKRPTSIKADIQLPELMEPLLFKCLQKDPEQRFSSMDELEGELKRVQGILLGQK